MNEPNEPSRRYIWEWFLAAAVVLGIVLAVLWVYLDVKKIERERFNRSPPSAAPK